MRPPNVHLRHPGELPDPLFRQCLDEVAAALAAQQPGDSGPPDESRPTGDSQGQSPQAPRMGWASWVDTPASAAFISWCQRTPGMIPAATPGWPLEAAAPPCDRLALYCAPTYAPRGRDDVRRETRWERLLRHDPFTFAETLTVDEPYVLNVGSVAYDPLGALLTLAAATSHEPSADPAEPWGWLMVWSASAPPAEHDPPEHDPPEHDFEGHEPGEHDAARHDSGPPRSAAVELRASERGRREAWQLSPALAHTVLVSLARALRPGEPWCIAMPDGFGLEPRIVAEAEMLALRRGTSRLQAAIGVDAWQSWTSRHPRARVVALPWGGVRWYDELALAHEVWAREREMGWPCATVVRPGPAAGPVSLTGGRSPDDTWLRECAWRAWWRAAHAVFDRAHAAWQERLGVPRVR